MYSIDFSKYFSGLAAKFSPDSHLKFKTRKPLIYVSNDVPNGNLLIKELEARHLRHCEAHDRSCSLTNLPLHGNLFIQKAKLYK